MPAIETSALVKHFGDTRAVDGIDLRVERGAVFGLLGPNGAGKTTTIRVLATLVLFPLTMASNIFVDPRTMPSLLQTLVGVNPVTHLANASRGLMHGNVEMSNVVWVLVASAVITGVFMPIAMRMYRKER